MRTMNSSPIGKAPNSVIPSSCIRAWSWLSPLKQGRVRHFRTNNSGEKPAGKTDIKKRRRRTQEKGHVTKSNAVRAYSKAVLYDFVNVALYLPHTYHVAFMIHTSIARHKPFSH